MELKFIFLVHFFIVGFIAHEGCAFIFSSTEQENARADNDDEHAGSLLDDVADTPEDVLEDVDHSEVVQDEINQNTETSRGDHDEGDTEVNGGNSRQDTNAQPGATADADDVWETLDDPLLHIATDTNSKLSRRRHSRGHRRGNNGKARGKTADDPEHEASTDVVAQQPVSSHPEPDPPSSHGAPGSATETGHPVSAHISNDFPTSRVTTGSTNPTQSSAPGQLSSVSENKYASPSCPKCSRADQESQLRTEEVKASILKRLGLAVAPKVAGKIHPLPFDFYETMVMNDQAEQAEEEEKEDEHAVRTKEIFIFGKDSEYSSFCSLPHRHVYKLPPTMNT